MPVKEANVVLAKCIKQNRPFGIRVEKRGDDWIRTWAFKVDETKAKNEGFDKTQISGSFISDSEYPGCPHCGADTFVRCSTCGKISCLKFGSPSAHCHWCGTQMDNITTADSFDVTSGGF
jgi:predicted RNA-binding Zn-ribbon protein involved in translation (DUF1610 family)